MSTPSGRYTVRGAGPWMVVDAAEPERHGELHRTREDAQREADRLEAAYQRSRAPRPRQAALFDSTQEA